MKKIMISGVMTVSLMLTIGVGAYSYNTIDRKNAEISDNKKIINKLNVDNADKNNRIKDIELRMKDIEKKFVQSEETTKKQEQQITDQTKKIEEQNSQIKNYESKISELEKELNFKKQKKGSDVKKTNNVEQPKVEQKNGRTITVEATAYTNHPSENGTYGGKVVTRTGLDISSSITYNGMGIIATDPDVIPLNSIVEIEGLGTYIALDTGSAIQGNRIDILMTNSNLTDNWGRRNVNVTILN
ncbi:cell wall-binding protein [Bacillus phage vB_BanS_Sophrita]|uniref:Cell wall-binding protein n=1 Tax=Bacillus phage vB_BanS_Sophrita TaxID=2894790 RepID=A0AAE8YTX6_9CAUD|nr:cell wall-binding protein [Bacillus phage vB_BanS_Sophrita]UGO50693.1 cell wall-binding protein [Bacillus phage vB_BanS_Sophrita]